MLENYGLGIPELRLTGFKNTNKQICSIKFEHIFQ